MQVAAILFENKGWAISLFQVMSTHARLGLKLIDSGDVDDAEANGCPGAWIAEHKPGAEAAVADAVKRVEAADNARDNAVQEAAELQRAVAESGTSVEFAHARAACVAVLRSGRGSAAYNKLLPLLRGFLRVPHAVVEDNVLALLGTGSGADFVEALTAPPPAKERAPS